MDYRQLAILLLHITNLNDGDDDYNCTLSNLSSSHRFLRKLHDGEYNRQEFRDCLASF